MVKTQIFIVCDNCEEPIKDTDVVWGYARFDEHYLVMQDKNYTDYYFDDECFEKVKEKTLKDIKNHLVSAIVTDPEDVSIFIPTLKESILFSKLIFNEYNAYYFNLRHNNKNILVKISGVENNRLEWKYEGFEEAIECIFSCFQHGRLMDFRREFKTQSDIKRYETMTASHNSATTSSIDGVVTTQVYG